MSGSLRATVVRLLSWEDAHVGFERVVGGLKTELHGRVPSGLPYSPWQLLEHIRIAQRDVLEFCRNPQYQERAWPDDYWPEGSSPPSSAAWDNSVSEFQADREALKQMALNPGLDLLEQVPAGNAEQTYLRELLLVADHTAYHLGQLVLLRRALGAWASGGP